MAEKTQLIAGIPLFSGCSQRELSKIAAMLRRVDVEPGDVLIREGDPGREFFVVARGRASVSADGRVLSTLGPGDFFGELALLTDYSRSATVAALEPMQLYAIADQDFQKMLDRSPTIIRKMMTFLAERLRDAENAPIY